MKKLNHLFSIATLFTILSCQNTPQIQEEQSWQLGPFEKLDKVNPILKPSTDLSFMDPIRKEEVFFEEKNVLNPTAVVKDGKVYLLYRAQDSMMTSRIALAISTDGVHFEKQAAPVFYPDEDHLKSYEWPGGVEDPRIVLSEDGRYILTYTSYDGTTARLFVATSKDLYNWQKHGPIFKDEKYIDMWSKSGAIVAEQRGADFIAKKINGRYWMYFGDTDLFMANSEDLISWSVLENAESQEMISVLHPRPGYFDSRLVEPGPFALYAKEGIKLIYNASNAKNNNDPNLPDFTYAAGQALFDNNTPYKLIDRSESYFMKPDKDYERVGEVNEVCFVEGLVYFNNRWMLYYGTADSKVAVAETN